MQTTLRKYRYGTRELQQLISYTGARPLLASWRNLAVRSGEGREGTTAEELSTDPNMAPRKGEQNREAGQGASKGHAKEPSDKAVQAEGENSGQDRPDVGSANVVDASKEKGATPSSGEQATEDRDNIQKSQLRGPSGRTDDSHTDHDEGIQRNEGADDPSSGTAQKFKNTSSDQNDMGSTA